MKQTQDEKLYHIGKSPFGTFILLWSVAQHEPKIMQVILPNPVRISEKIYRTLLSREIEKSCSEIDRMAAQITSVLEGERQQFSLDSVRLDLCPEFQQRVLRAEFQIPYGYVTHYKRLAIHLGHPNASRAVGNALSNNPFPIIIPCHRAVRSDFSVGGFQGGEVMKRSLLSFEGNEFNDKKRIKNPRLFY
ncbi:MAG: methylated-DNA--[protein]-cysteine S-methyltransferase [Candidatus Zhuqueibacterota bacterium]